jgi:hypothetical protein
VWTVSAAMPRHKIHHASPSLRCPHCRGQARHLFYHSSYRTRDGRRKLWQCSLCGQCLSERRATAFFNLKTAEMEVCRSLDAMLRGDTQTSTAHSRGHRRESLTSRSRNRYLVRKTYAFAKTVPYMDGQCALDKTVYNFCRKHGGLKAETPAMRQGLTDHVWSITEVLR